MPGEKVRGWPSPMMKIDPTLNAADDEGLGGF